MKTTLPQEHEAFITHYDLYNDAIFRFCLTKVRDRDLALDLTQDTFIRAWNYLQKGVVVENMRALLYRIARNLIIDFTRKKHEESLDSILETGLDFESRRELEDMHTFADMRIALQLIDQLEKPTRDIIIMRFLDGLSVNEIAEFLEVEPNTISVRIHRALQSLQKSMISKTATSSHE